MLFFLFLISFFLYKIAQASEYRKKQRQTLTILNIDLLELAKAESDQNVHGLFAQNYRRQKSLLQWRLLQFLKKGANTDPLFARVMLPRAEKILSDGNAEITVVYEQKWGRLFRALFPVNPRAISLKAELIDQECEDTVMTIEDVPNKLMQDFVDLDHVVRFLASGCGIYVNEY